MTAHLQQKARRLAYFTVAYNLAECLLSLLAGALAECIALVGLAWTACWRPCPEG